MSNHLDRTFDTHAPIELYVENGRGTLDVTATDTTETTVRITGERPDESMSATWATGSRSSPPRARPPSSARPVATMWSSRSRSPAR